MVWLTRDEVVAKCRICYVSIWRRIRTGDFPRGRNVCGKILWKESDIDAWLEAQPRQRLKGDGEPRPVGHSNLRNVGETVEA